MNNSPTTCHEEDMHSMKREKREQLVKAAGLAIMGLS